MAVEERRRIVGVEWRAGAMDGPGILSGVAMRFGDTAVLPWGRERFEPGSLSADPDGVILNVQHDRGRPLSRFPDGGLELEFRADALEVRAAVADTTDGRDAVALVRAGVLRGLSVEFRADAERLVDGVRVVTRARLSGIAVVDDGAYDAATVAAERARMRSNRKGQSARGPAGEWGWW